MAEDSKVLVETVSPTALGAKVNWLVTKAGILVRNGTPDERIDKAFERHAPSRGATLHEVIIVLVAGNE